MPQDQLELEDAVVAPFSLTLDRTAEWVQAQASETYDDSPPPSPAYELEPEQVSPSNRTTVSSDQSRMSQPTPQLNPLIPIRPTNQREQTREADMSPFPCSPPGSGYPMPLEMGPPRAEAHGHDDKMGGRSKKRRRSSLLDSIRAFSTPSVQKRRDETDKRG